MIRPDQIPAEAVEAAARALYDILRAEIDPLDWTEIGDWRQNYFRKEALAAIAAALGAWPMAHLYTQPCYVWNGVDAACVFPVPTEANKD